MKQGSKVMTCTSCNILNRVSTFTVDGHKTRQSQMKVQEAGCHGCREGRDPSRHSVHLQHIAVKRIFMDCISKSFSLPLYARLLPSSEVNLTTTATLSTVVLSKCLSRLTQTWSITCTSFWDVFNMPLRWRLE